MARLSTLQLARALGVEQTSISFWRRDRAFPEPALIYNDKMSFYDTDQVAEWLNSQNAKRAIGGKLDSARAHFESRVQSIMREISLVQV